MWAICGVFLLSGCRTTKKTFVEVDAQSVERILITQIIDAQKQELETILLPEGTIIETLNTGEALKITFSSDMLFVVNSNIVSESSKNLLCQFAESLNNYLDTHIQIICHTDNTGRADYSQTLSERRAKSVYDFLRDLGVNPTRMAYFGKGIHEPVADNNTIEGRTLNRRIEIFIIFAQ